MAEQHVQGLQPALKLLLNDAGLRSKEDNRHVASLSQVTSST